MRPRRRSLWAGEDIPFGRNRDACVISVSGKGNEHKKRVCPGGQGSFFVPRAPATYRNGTSLEDKRDIRTGFLCRLSYELFSEADDTQELADRNFGQGLQRVPGAR